MKYNKLLIIASASVLLFSLLLFSFEKFHLIDLYSKHQVAQDSQDPRPINSVDYTPQTSPPDPTINSEKNSQISSSSETPNTNKTSVMITRANQDPINKNLNIGVLIDGTKSGTCNLAFSQNDKLILTKAAPVTEQSGLVTCAGFSVLNNEIPSAGTYTIEISVDNAIASQNVELTK